MITRSAIKNKSQCEVTTPLSPATKKKGKNATEDKINIQKPAKADKSESTLKDVQSPVFNIHLHMTPSMDNNLSEPRQIQPVIHLHFGEPVNKLSPATLENVETIHKTLKIDLPFKVNFNSEKQSNLLESHEVKPFEKSKACKKLSFNKLQKNPKNLGAEKSEAVVESFAKTEGNIKSPRGSVCKTQQPVRRSIRQENNRKLLKTLKDFRVNKSITTENEGENLCKNVKRKKKSESVENKLSLKEPMVVLYDINKIMTKTTTTFCDGVVVGKKEVEKEEDFTVTYTSSQENDSSEKVEKFPYDLSCESEKSAGNEESDQTSKLSQNDENVISVNKEHEEICSLVDQSNNEETTANNSISDFSDTCTFSENVKINLQYIVDSEKDFDKTSLDIDDKYEKVTENCQINNNTLLPSEEYKITECDLSNLSLKDQSINSEHTDISSDRVVSLNSKSNDLDDNSDDESDSNISAPDLSHRINFEDNHQCASLTDSDVETVCLKNEDSNLLKSTIKENNLSPTESDDYKNTIDVDTLHFQLKLIRKEMKKRDMNVKNGASGKKSLKKKTNSMTTKNVPGKSSVKEINKRSNKWKKKMLTAKYQQKFFSSDYMPLNVSGPTKFAVAQIKKIEPYKEHKAKNFKEEMLFGKRVSRFSDPKHVQIYMLKKQAAGKRSK